MRKLVVVNNPASWSLEADGVDVVSARQYLTDPGLAQVRNVHVFNLCREYRFGSKGYYVSLLAEARGHRVVPSAKTIQDLKTPSIVRVISDELDELVDRTLAGVTEPEFQLGIYFGESVGKRDATLARELYRLFQAPLLKARFVRGTRWTLQNVRAIAMSDIPEEDLDFLREAAQRYFRKSRVRPPAADRFSYDLAILVNPQEKNPPSDKRAIQRFVDAAQEQGFSTELISRDDYGRIGEFDALLIRETTWVDHYTYRMSRRAQSEGLAVIDDPDSILRCTNKVFLAELLQGSNVPTPRTLIVHDLNRGSVADELGLPCVLKLPDSSFSRGVTRADSREQLQARLDAMLSSQELVIAQSYTPTDFDWRIGVLDGEPLFACKYYMARGHWQIYNWDKQKKSDVEGGWETVAASEAPSSVLDVAVRAARLVGDGLYGVDVKDIDGQGRVIEVNDNPNIDAGVEDQVLGAELYNRVIGSLRTRIEARRTVHGR